MAIEVFRKSEAFPSSECHSFFLNSLKKLSERLQHLAVPTASPPVPSATQARDAFDSQKCFSHGMWVDKDLYEIVHDFVDARPPLPSKALCCRLRRIRTQPCRTANKSLCLTVDCDSKGEGCGERKSKKRRSVSGRLKMFERRSESELFECSLCILLSLIWPV